MIILLTFLDFMFVFLVFIGSIFLIKYLKELLKFREILLKELIIKLISEKRPDNDTDFRNYISEIVDSIKNPHLDQNECRGIKRIFNLHCMIKSSKKNYIEFLKEEKKVFRNIEKYINISLYLIVGIKFVLIFYQTRNLFQLFITVLYTIFSFYLSKITEDALKGEEKILKIKFV